MTLSLKKSNKVFNVSNQSQNQNKNKFWKKERVKECEVRWKERWDQGGVAGGARISKHIVLKF